MRKLSLWAGFLLAAIAVSMAFSATPPYYPPPGGGGATGANPSASITGTVINGSASTFMRSDAAPAIASGVTLTAPVLGTPASGVLDNCTFHLTINTQAGTPYVGVLTDDGKEVQMTDASANIFEIDVDANVNYPVGTQINVVQYGAGATTIQAVTSGTTTIHSVGGTAAAPIINARYGSAVCIKQAANVWLVVGNIK